MRHITLSGDAWTRLVTAGVATRTRPAAFEVTGPGALTCLQGLLTNDLDGPGAGSLVYGALLTPKGAIVVDYWVLRLAERFLLLAEPEGHDPSLELFRRSLPPRLARATDLTGRLEAAWLTGPIVPAALAAAGLELPDGGRVAASGEVLLARPAQAAPFSAVLLGTPELLAPHLGRLADAGLAEGTEGDREAARIVAGWPRLGAEIGERTLVQEVRYDEISGVSYSKGCYTGQETVARLHFRGHTNRELRGLRWNGAAPEGDEIVAADGREAGTVTSVLSLPDRALGLGLIRREVAPDTPVTAGGQPAVVTALPFPAA